MFSFAIQLWVFKYKESSVSAEVLATQIYFDCQKEKYYEECYREKFAKTTESYDLGISQEVLKKLWEKDERTRSCHSLAHAMAFNELKKDPSKWKEFLKNIDPQFCSGGLFHGILEAHLGNDPNFKFDEKQIENICKSSNAYSEGSCVHISGHLLLVESDGDIDLAMKTCDKISLPTSSECYSGIFMENMTKENLQIHGIAKQLNWSQSVAQDFEKLCLKYSGKTAKGCWGEMGLMYASVKNDDPSETYKMCQRAPNGDYSFNCYRHALAKIAVTADNQSKVDGLCTPYTGNAEKFNTCLYTVINSLGITSSKFVDRAKNLCNTLNDLQKTNCVNYVSIRFVKT